MNHNTLPNDAELWRKPRVEGKCGLKSSRIYELVAEGKFPRPVKLGPRASAWVSTEVLAWIAERIAERDGGTSCVTRKISIPSQDTNQNKPSDRPSAVAPACTLDANSSLEERQL